MEIKTSRRVAIRWGGILFLLSALLCLCSVVMPLTVYAEDDPWSAAEAPPDDTNIGAVYLCNVENRIVLHEKNADTLIYPTSSVKIMTGFLACRELADRTEETVQITAAMLAGSTGRNMGLVAGEEIKIYDLLMAATCGSYNDAACAVAYLSAGSVDTFVDWMNREAQRIGAVNTVYKNPTGIHDPLMVTTARDTAMISREALQNEFLMSLLSTHTYTVPATNASDARMITNRNALVSDTGGQYYNGWCRGMNAGMTDEGGWCVITLWEKNGASNLSVVMNGADVAVGQAVPAYTYTNRLLGWAGRCYGYRTVLTAGEALDTLPVTMTGTSKSQTDLFIPTDLKIYLPTHVDLAASVKAEYHLYGDALTAPLTEGETVGTVTVTYEGQVLGSSPVVVMEAFERNGFLDVMDGFKSYLVSRACLSAVVIFVILLLIYLKYTTGPGARYTSKQVYTPPKRRNKKFRTLRRSRR